MRLIAENFRKLRCAWNKKQITPKRLDQLYRRTKLRIKHMPLRVPGFIMTLRGISFVAVNESLPDWLKFKIELHEFAHHILHPGKPHFYQLDPSMKEECEAELFAVCALIPLPLFKKIQCGIITLDELDLPYELYEQRKAIYDTYKI